MPDYQEERTNRFVAVEGEYAGYTVRDPNGGKIGKVDDLFLDEDDRPEYIGVKMGFFGTRSTLIPLDACTVDEGRGFVEVNKSKQAVNDAPNFDGGEVTPDYERRVREYYGLGAVGGSEDRGGYAAYYDGDEGRDGDEASYHGFAGAGHGGDGISYHGSDGVERAGYAASYHGGDSATASSRTGHADEERQGRGGREGVGDSSGKVGVGMHEGDVQEGEFRGHSADNEGVDRRGGSDLEDEDELRVR